MTSTEFSISSPAFLNNAMIPIKHTCKGEGVSPPLRLCNVPNGAKSLAIIMHDPDAPGGDFTHWTMWNIPAATTLIMENDAPTGTSQGSNDAGTIGYTGPCPPSGTHQYIFELYALDDKLVLAEGSSRGSLENMINKHLLRSAELTGFFTR